MNVEMKRIVAAIGSLLGASPGYAAFARRFTQSAGVAQKPGSKYNGEDGPRAIARRKRQIEQRLICPVFESRPNNPRRVW